jgi:hypothetical protein
MTLLLFMLSVINKPFVLNVVQLSVLAPFKFSSDKILHYNTGLFSSAVWTDRKLNWKEPSSGYSYQNVALFHGLVC